MIFRFPRPWVLALLAFLLVAPARGDGFDPNRMLLTWQRDPTTTMTVQWLQRGERLPLAEGQSDQVQPWQVPYVGPVTLGDGQAWAARGLAVDFLADAEHQRPEPADFAARARLGWNEQGLLVLVHVADDAAVEQGNEARLWQADSVELIVSTGVGSLHRYQVVVAPGMDPRYPEPRHRFHIRSDSGLKAEELTLERAAKRLADQGGYSLEVLLPWSNLPRLTPQRGATLGLQIYVNDRDPETPDNGTSKTHRVSWHPCVESSYDHRGVQPLQLTDAPPAAAADRGRAEVRRAGADMVLDVYALGELAGKTVRLQAGTQQLGTAMLQAQGQVATASIPVPAAPAGQRWGVLTVMLEDDQPLVTAEVPAWTTFAPPAPVAVDYWRRGEDTRGSATTAVATLPQWPGMFRQRVELTGLTPDSEYRFQARGYSHDYGFRTMPRQLHRPLRLAVGGDTRANQMYMEQMGEVAMQHKPDLVVWGGDLAYANGREFELFKWEEWFQAMHNSMIDEQRRVVPIVVAIGNHEVRSHSGIVDSDEWRIDVSPYFYQFFAFPGQPGYGVLDFGDYLSLLLLDTGHTNPIPGKQTQWLEQVLAPRRNVPHVFPVYHVPAYPSYRPFDGSASKQVREQWVPLFEKHGLRLVFENHDHTFKRTHPIRDGKVDPAGITYVGDGAWGVNSRPVRNFENAAWYLQKAQSIRHCIILTLEPTRRHLLVVDWEGKTIDEFEQEVR